MSFKKIMAAVLTAAMVIVNGCASSPAVNSKDKDKDEKENHTTSFIPFHSAGVMSSGGTTSNISGSSSSVSSEGHSGIGSSAGRGGSVSAAS